MDPQPHPGLEMSDKPPAEILLPASRHPEQSLVEVEETVAGDDQASDPQPDSPEVKTPLMRL